MRPILNSIFIQFIFLIVFLPVLTAKTTINMSTVNAVTSMIIGQQNNSDPSSFPLNPGTSIMISGLITKSQIPIEGVTISFTGLGSVTTNSSGYYSILVPYNWSGTATPVYCDYNFSPASRTYVSVKTEKLNENYTGTVSTYYTISGVVTYSENGQPFACKGIAFGNGITVLTNNSGQYELELPSCWNGTFTPASNGVTFTPSTRNYSYIQQNYFNQNYQVSNPSIIRPPNWDYPNTGVVHIIALQYTSLPDVCGEALQPGDWIGTFFKNTSGQLVCAGAAQWTGASSNIALLPQGDDPYTTVKDGFAYGEVFNWRIFRWSDSTEHLTYVTYQTGIGMSADNKFYNNGLSLVSAIDGYKYLNMTIPEGWSGFSSWFLPPNALKPVNVLFQPVISNMTILQTLTKMYYPAQNINTIVNWNSRAGYEIKLSDTVVLPFYGCLETNRTVSMTTGWNLLPVMTPCEISISQFLSSVISKIIIVQEVAKPNIYWPAMGINTIQNLQPGKAYLVKVNANTLVTYTSNWLNCDQEELKANIIPEPVITHPWNEISANPSAHYVVFPSEVLTGFKAGQIIGAFTRDGICAGITRISNPDENQILVIYSDDSYTSEKEGFDYQELISYKVFDPNDQTISNINVGYDFSQPSFDGLFLTGGISKIKTIDFSSSDIPETGQATLVISPNPANQYFSLSTSLNSDKIKLSIYNSTGQLILDERVFVNEKIDVNNLKPGVYYIKVKDQFSTRSQKLLIQR